MASLHSRYDPRGEAEKYLNSLNLGASVKYFILIEPGEGYLIPVLRRRFPPAKIVVLHACPPRQGGEEGVPVWHPGCGQSVAQFLEAQIPDTEAGAVKLVEWRPALALYGKAYWELLKGAANFIRRADANARTLRGFGRRWMRNFFRNLRLPLDFTEWRRVSGPVVITGSGPSLEEALPQIRVMAPRPLILAASSSVMALYAGGLVPDMVIGTDGSGWALIHLRECLRYPGRDGGSGPDHGAPFVLALSLCAALPSQCAEAPVIALNDGSLWQSLVYRGLGIPSLAVPSRGTVTASALDLALALGSGNIFLCGMDLAVRDIRTHARPYGFDFLMRDTRFSPLYSLAFSRSGELRRGRSHEVYASWFDEERRSWAGRVFSLGANHPVFDDLQIPATASPARPASTPSIHDGLPCPAGGRALDGVPDTARRFRAVSGSAGNGGNGSPAGSPAGRAAGAADILLGALKDPGLADPLMKELVPLLFPEKREAGLREVAAELAALGYGKKE
ncbi:MAG: DUF115 domain-containing protein [Treponema sp.]|jgi:hypothetical protein|nr:DUF115 domain-containing protein [Treponema sp.]